jgi:hypothetical protein
MRPREASSTTSEAAPARTAIQRRTRDAPYIPAKNPGGSSGGSGPLIVTIAASAAKSTQTTRTSAAPAAIASTTSAG